MKKYHDLSEVERVPETYKGTCIGCVYDIPKQYQCGHPGRYYPSCKGIIYKLKQPSK